MAPDKTTNELLSLTLEVRRNQTSAEPLTAHERQQVILTLPDLLPGKVSYRASLEDRDVHVKARVWIEVLGDRSGEFELGFTYDSTTGRKKLTWAQQDAGPRLVQTLRTQMTDALKVAGWVEIRAGFWRHSSFMEVSASEPVREMASGLPDSIPSDLATQDEQIREPRANWRRPIAGAQAPGTVHPISVYGRSDGSAPAYIRREKARLITFVCVVCGTEVTEYRYHGFKPHYCSEACHQKASELQNEARVAKQREKRQRLAQQKQRNT